MMLTGSICQLAYTLCLPEAVRPLYYLLLKLLYNNKSTQLPACVARLFSMEIRT